MDPLTTLRLCCCAPKTKHRHDLLRNSTWVERMSDYFDSVNVSQNGWLTIEQILECAENMELFCKPTQPQIKKLRRRLTEFWAAVGLRSGVRMSKQEFVRGLNTLADREWEKRKRGEETLHERLNSAFFDVMDLNNDGVVTLEEMRVVMQACNSDPEDALQWLEFCDMNKDGLVQRREFVNAEFDYWFPRC